MTHDDNEPYPLVKPYPNETALISHVKESVKKGMEKNGGKEPRVIVIGALGRCGSGSVDLCEKVGLGKDSILKWDMAETKKGGPFDEIVECKHYISDSGMGWIWLICVIRTANVFINCIYLTGKIPPFVTLDAINNNKDRKLRVICDVACDPNSPYNPVPIYEIWTTFEKPTVEVKGVEYVHHIILVLLGEEMLTEYTIIADLPLLLSPLTTYQHFFQEKLQSPSHNNYYQA